MTSITERVNSLEGLENETRSAVSVILTRLGFIEKKYDKRFDELESRFDYQNKRIGDIKTTLLAFQKETRERLGGLETRMDGLETRIEKLEVRMEKLEQEVTGIRLDVSEIKEMLSTLIAQKN